MAKIKITDAVELKMYKLLFEEGISQNKTSKLLNLSAGSVNKYYKLMKKEDYEPPKVSLEELEALDAINEYNGLSREQKMEKAFDGAINMLYEAVTKAQEGWIIEDERRVRIPIKTLMDCIEKAGKHAKTMAEAAKLAASHLSTETIDYKKMAKLFITFNEKTGKFAYNSKEHMEKVLNKAYRKD